MSKIKVICPKCGSSNTMEDFFVINKVMHEKCRKCGLIQEMSLLRCIREPELLM